MVSYVHSCWPYLFLHLSFRWCLGRAVLCDCGNFWVSSHKFQPAHNKTYYKTCATSEDAEQPADPHSLISLPDCLCLVQPPCCLKKKWWTGTLTILCGCTLWCESLRVIDLIVGFVVRWTIFFRLNGKTCDKICICLLRVHFEKKISKKTYLVMFMRFFFMFMIDCKSRSQELKIDFLTDNLTHLHVWN